MAFGQIIMIQDVYFCNTFPLNTQFSYTHRALPYNPNILATLHVEHSEMLFCVLWVTVTSGYLFSININELPSLLLAWLCFTCAVRLFDICK